MQQHLKKKNQRKKRKLRIRKKINGSELRPRLVVFRSLRHVYAQLIDDVSHRTLVGASSLKLGLKSGNKDAAQKVGELVAQKASVKGIKSVCFDRNGYRYHGVVKVLADAARKEGLIF